MDCRAVALQGSVVSRVSQASQILHSSFLTTAHLGVEEIAGFGTCLRASWQPKERRWCGVLIRAVEKGLQTEDEEDLDVIPGSITRFLPYFMRRNSWAVFLDPFQNVGERSASRSNIPSSLYGLNHVCTAGDLAELLRPGLGISSLFPLGLNSAALNEDPISQDMGGLISTNQTAVFPAATIPDIPRHYSKHGAFFRELASGVSCGPQGFQDSVSFPLHISPKSIISRLTAPSVDMAGCTRSAAPDLAPQVSYGAHSRPQAELCAKNAECVTVEDLGSIGGLGMWLTERLPSGRSQIALWGTAPGTKRVANLWTELVEGEISLEDARPPKRTVHVARVKIRNEAGLYLIEAYQEMADGQTRVRNRPLSEKMRPGENVEDACLRGIVEELGYQMGGRDRVSVLPETYTREEEERESFSYPGLLTRYVIHTMVALVKQLPDAEFSTVENEGTQTNGGLVASAAGDASGNGSLKHEECALGVKRHFWRWISESELP